jgi:hypothetical protein
MQLPWCHTEVIFVTFNVRDTEQCTWFIIYYLLDAIIIHDIRVLNVLCSASLQFINIFRLMDADDMVVILETPAGLQNMLDTVYNYSRD